MTYEKFNREFLQWKASNPDWRAGQTMFNVLAYLDEHAAESIRGTNADPYYNDALIPSFFAWMADFYGWWN